MSKDDLKELLKDTKKKIDDKAYEEALVLIEEIFKIDSDNKRALVLKNKCIKHLIEQISNEFKTNFNSKLYFPMKENLTKMKELDENNLLYLKCQKMYDSKKRVILRTLIKSEVKNNDYSSAIKYTQEYFDIFFPNGKVDMSSKEFRELEHEFQQLERWAKEEQKRKIEDALS